MHKQKTISLFSGGMVFLYYKFKISVNRYYEIHAIFSSDRRMYPALP